MLILGDNTFHTNFEDVVRRQREQRADAVFLVEEVYLEEASRCGVCDTNKYGESRMLSKNLMIPSQTSW